MSGALAGSRRVLLGLVLAIVIAWIALAHGLEAFVNRKVEIALPAVTPEAQTLHAASFVSDLHADSLLFERDLLKRSRLGHVDLPRLAEGGVALQVFAVPTVVPITASVDGTIGGGLDAITLAGITQLSPMAWMSPTERALHRARELASFAEDSNGAMQLVSSREDLEQLAAARREGAERIGALLAIEGGHAMESDPAALRTLFDAGYRMVGLSHFFDNDYAGSAHGTEKGGLTDLGRATIQEMERLGMVVDVAHMSPAAFADTMAIASRPVVFSHGGVRGTCDNQRNLSDDQVREIAAGGGIVGIGSWPLAVCGYAPADVARALVHVVRLVGADHAALGSDYDGAVAVGFDISGIAMITQALLDAGLEPAAIRKILGENVLRVLLEVLPRETSARSR